LPKRWVSTARSRAVIVAGLLHGTLAQNADGGFTYTLDADWNGKEVFTYQMNDGELDSTVRIVVAAVNNASSIAPCQEGGLIIPPAPRGTLGPSNLGISKPPTRR
jgi:ABC-type molybdate transport system substrate-binding protein